LTTQSSLKIGTSSHVNRLEHKGPTILESKPAVHSVFEEALWYPYCTRLEGSHFGMAKAFAQSFDGKRENIAGLRIQVTEDSIRKACNIHTDGERWFKNKIITVGDINQLPKDEIVPQEGMLQIYLDRFGTILHRW